MASSIPENDVIADFMIVLGEWIISGFKKSKKMGMFLSGLPDLANFGQFWPVCAKFSPLKAS